MRTWLPQLGTVVDTKALWQTIVYSAAAGIGVTLAFALALLGAARYLDLTRDGRVVSAFAFAALAVLALAAIAAALVLGIIVMTTKS